MEQPRTVEEPFPVSKIGGRYFIFDIDVVTHLRRNYNIMGVFSGCIPMAPQQNIFMGLPIQLLPEEVQLLMLKGVAYIADDVAFHKQRISSLEGTDRQLCLQMLRSESRKARKLADAKLVASREHGLAKQAAERAARQASSTFSAKSDSFASESTIAADEDSLFSGGRPASPASALKSSLSSVTLSSKSLAITPSTTYPPLTVPRTSADQVLPDVPVSFPLFAHLYEKGYFMAPGLRFGCHYSVYPGDPLRFHAHFLGRGYDWDEEVPLLDIVGGGRLGTGVKKGFLMGGRDTSKPLEGDDHVGENVRTFCIEWGGM